MRDSSLVLFAATLVLLLASPVVAEGPRDSVFKIEVTSRQPDLIRPWSKRSPGKSSGSGVMISGRRILTNAHVIRHASQIEVQATGSSDKHEARLLAVAPGMDLALLELEDPSVVEGVPALEIDPELPELRRDVTVLGYPVGGDELSITEGIVSRIEFTRYYYSQQGLRVQIDAALNPGNSGGPAISDGRIIGLVFSKIEEADGIGYLIPSEEILTFLADVEDGRYDGKAGVAGDTSSQRLESPTLRRRFGLDASTTGVLINHTAGVPEGSVQRWDVLTHIGPHPIDNQGFVRVKDSLRLAFNYYLQRLATDEGVPLTVFRDGESVELLAPTERDSDRLLAPLKHGYPEYFIWGPVVFSAASQELVYANRSRMMALLAATQSPLLGALSRRREFEGEEMVIIPTRLFPHRTTRGYGTVAMAVVESVNDTPVKSLAHLVELLRDCKDKYVELDLGGAYETLVFDREKAEEATEEILTDEGIRRRGSKRLRKIWDAE